MTRSGAVLRLLRGGERGQAIWWMLLIVPLFVIGAAIVIDGSVWYGHRRVYQKTADASALAGAQELLSRTGAADMESRALLAADDWKARNDVPPSDFVNGTPLVVNDCWGVTSFDGLPDGVIVDVSKEAPLLFMRAFGGVAPFDIGAHARVCIGTPQLGEGLLPFGIPINTSECFDDDGTPLFGEDCYVAIRVPEGQSGEAQYLKLWDSPSDDPEDWSRRCSDKNANISNQDFVQQIARGARTWCSVDFSDEGCPYDPGSDEIGHCVYSDTGNRAKWAVQGLQIRLLSEGACDAEYASNPAWRSYPDAPPSTIGDGIDQWWEALEPANGADWPELPVSERDTFAKRDCTAPRLVTVVLIDEYEQQGNPPYPIRDFATFFIAGCSDDDGEFDSHCLTKNEGGPLSNTGHLWMKGFFFNYVDIGGPGGSLTPYGRMQLYLIE